MPPKKKSKIYILGAGIAGATIAREIADREIFGDIAAFLDDDTRKIGTKIDGVPVLGPIQDVIPLVNDASDAEALIAMPSVSSEHMRQLYNQLRESGFVKIRLLPNISQIIDGDAHLVLAREIDPQDLLTREVRRIALHDSISYLRDKRVLITGAGGSIGSEIVRQLLTAGAERLYLFGHGENSIYEIERELRILQKEGVGKGATIVPVIGDLQDRDYIHYIVKQLKAHTIFHCAAYKHVPLMEQNPVEAIKNNVFGTKNLVDASIATGTARLILISTDKAVSPASIYGCSKKLAEDIVINGNSDTTQCMVVRFGNVLGSRGSILPLFKKQILTGGPVTITTPNASRYFMTIPEAASLVLQAGGVGKGGEKYLLDMGEPINIQELAETMIRFYGYTPFQDIKIEYIGLRPGEKELESLISIDESVTETEFSGIQRLQYPHVHDEALYGLIEKLKDICFMNEKRPDLFRNRNELQIYLQSYIPVFGSLVKDQPARSFH